MVNQNQLMQLFVFSCQGDQRTPGTCFYQLEFATQEVSKFQWLETALVAIAFAGSDVEGVRLAVAAIPGFIFVDVCFFLPFCVTGLKPSTFAKN